MRSSKNRVDYVMPAPQADPEDLCQDLSLIGRNRRTLGDNKDKKPCLVVV